MDNANGAGRHQVQQPHAGYRSNRPGKCAVEHAQGFRTPQLHLGDIVQHIGIQANEHGYRCNGVAQQTRREQVSSGYGK